MDNNFFDYIRTIESKVNSILEKYADKPKVSILQSVRFKIYLRGGSFEAREAVERYFVHNNKYSNVVVDNKELLDGGFEKIIQVIPEY